MGRRQKRTPSETITLWCDRRVTRQEVMSSNPKCISQDAVAKSNGKALKKSPLATFSVTCPSAIHYVCVCLRCAGGERDPVRSQASGSSQPCHREKTCPSVPTSTLGTPASAVGEGQGGQRGQDSRGEALFTLWSHRGSLEIRWLRSRSF